MYTMLGYLVPGGYVTNPRLWYCPSSHDPNLQFNTLQNRWPPTTFSTRTSYSCRPEVAWPAPAWAPTNGLPLLPRLSGPAILSDIIQDASGVNAVHQDGVNVCYVDGSVKWVSRKLFDADLTVLTPFFLEDFNEQNIWNTFDRQY